MNPQVFEKLQRVEDAEDLKAVLAQVCGKFGKRPKIELLSDGSSGYFCYMNLSSSEDNAALCKELDGFRYGDDVCIRIPMELNRAA